MESNFEERLNKNHQISPLKFLIPTTQLRFLVLEGIEGVEFDSEKLQVFQDCSCEITLNP